MILTLRKFIIMIQNSYIISFVLLLFLSACMQADQKQNPKDEATTETSNVDSLKFPDEVHLKNIRQLTFGGDNAEAYWSFDNSMLVFQSNFKEWDVECDQIFYFDPNGDDLASSTPKMLSTGKGRTTCSYFMPGDSTILYASTHQFHENCPPVPERREDGKYVWPIYKEYDIYISDLDGNILKQLTDHEGYDAEATVSPAGDKIVFTSDRSGDLELYVMDIDGSNLVQITDQLGYDGGAFFSPDGKSLVFRSSRPKTEGEIANYKSLLAEGLVQPTEMEIYTVNVDGSNLKQVTQLGKANWAPFYHPSGEKIVFSSNHAGKRGYEFNLYMIDTDGQNLKRVSYDTVFDAFPMFSYDGKYIVFSSNRNNNGTRDTNLFLAEWVD